MEKNLDQHLSEITSKVKKLKARVTRLEAENEDLRKSTFNYLEQLDLQKKETERILLSIKHGQVGQAMDTDKKVLLKEIDKYVLMIDKCIAAVNANL